MEYNKLIAGMHTGDDVEGFYVLKDAFLKTTAAGKPFLSGVLADRSGTIDLKVWDYSGPIGANPADTGRIVKIRGQVSEFKGAPQLTAGRIRMADGNDRIYTGGYPGPLRELCGLWLDERDALPPDESRRLSISDDDGYTCGLVCDLICPEGAEVKARYASGFYSGTAAVTARCYGHGQTWCFGTKPDDAAFDRLMDEVVRESGVRPLIHELTRLEIACREKDGQRFWFVLNFTAEPQPLPRALVGMLDLLSSETVTEQIELPPYGVLLLEENKSS